MKRLTVKILFIILIMTFFIHCKKEVSQPAQESNKIKELYEHYVDQQG